MAAKTIQNQAFYWDFMDLAMQNWDVSDSKTEWFEFGIWKLGSSFSVTILCGHSSRENDDSLVELGVDKPMLQSKNDFVSLGLPQDSISQQSCLPILWYIWYDVDLERLSYTWNVSGKWSLYA